MAVALVIFTFLAIMTYRRAVRPGMTVKQHGRTAILALVTLAQAGVVLNYL